MPQGGSCDGGKVSAPWEAPSLAGRSAWMEEEFWSLGGECSNQFAEAKMGSNLHRRSALPPFAPQHDMLMCCCGWGLGAQASEVRPRKRTGVGCVETA